jgi:hypothetical protein
VGIDTAGKLSRWAKEISELIPTEGRNSAQNKLGLAPGRFVPNQLKTSFPRIRADALFALKPAATKTFVSMTTPSIQTSSITSWRRSRLRSSRIAPSSRASTSRLGSGSKAMIGSQPAIRAAINPARPTRRPHKPRSTVPRRTLPHSAPHRRGAARRTRRAARSSSTTCAGVKLPNHC